MRTVQLREIQKKQVEALVSLNENRTDEAVSRMWEAVAIADGPGMNRYPPDSGIGLPVDEVFGEILLDLGRYREAQAEFEAARARTPNRLHSMMGLARASARAGDPAAARRMYREVLDMLSGADAELPDAAEAETYLAGG